MSRRLALLPAAIAGIAGCNGTCSQNAVAIVEQLQALGPTISTIEVYSDTNGNGVLEHDERAFVIDASPTVAKALRIEFLMPQPRSQLGVQECSSEPCDTFLEFASFVQPQPEPSPWVESMFFNDDPTDTATTGNEVNAVTYVLHDNLVEPLLATNATPVTVTVRLDRLGDSYQPFRFPFVLARQIAPGDSHIPPRIVATFPTPATPLPGWGRPLTPADLGGGTLDQLLARADSNFVGTTLVERIAPHEPIVFTFDRPMTNMVVSVDPFPATPSQTDPAGIELVGASIGFVTPFTVATSDTPIGMAPDQIYSLRPTANNELDRVPFLRGTQSDQGKFLIPNFDNDLYDALRNAGYSDILLSGSPRYQFRTGPFRITAPANQGITNLANAPNGRIVGRLQFARPTEGIAAPATVAVTVTGNGLSPTTSPLPFPAGAPDTIQQDSFVRTAGVTVHDVAVQLPDKDFDDVVTIAMEVTDAAGNLLGHDSVRVHHDVIAPTIDPNLSFTNDYADGQLDQVCIAADCDIDHFIYSVNGGPPMMLFVSSASQVSACTNDRRQYCFSRVFLNLSEKQPLQLTISAVDDQGNSSAASVTVPIPRPGCQLEDKFIAGGGRQSAITTAPDGTPMVAWVNGTTLGYSETDYGGAWRKNRSVAATLQTGHTYGAGIDLIRDPTDGNPIVCYVDAPAGQAFEATVGTLFIKKYNGTTWTVMSQQPNVRPMGCSLAWLGTSGIVAWSEPGGARWGSILAPSLGREIPHPNLQVASDELHDVSIATHNGRIYFAYQASHPESGLVTAPGYLIAGYFDPGAPPHLEQLCSSSNGCFGWGPRIIADDDGVAAAMVVADDDSLPPYDALRKVLIKWNPEPPAGHNIFASGITNQRFTPLGAYDYLSDPDLEGILQPVYARIGIARTPDHAVIVGYARTVPISSSPLPDSATAFVGREGVATVRIDTTNGHAAFVEVERRIGSDGPFRTEAVDVQISTGPDGYNLVYRNPAIERLVFSSETHSIPSDTSFQGNFRCGRAFGTATLTEAQMNLTYVDIPPDADGHKRFWTQECARLGDVTPLERPFELFGETVGDRDTILRDVVIGLKLQDGRGPLRSQKRVCLPISAATGRPDATICDPDIGNSQSFQPASETQFTQSTSSDPPPGVTAASITTYTNFFDAFLNCPDGDQIYRNVLVPNSPWLCIKCPAPPTPPAGQPPGQRVFDPESASCVLVNTGTCLDFRYPDVGVNEKPRFIQAGSLGANRVFCMSCPTEPNIDHGIMPWAVTSDGLACSRCVEGSRLYTCNDDEDCTEFPNAYCSGKAWGRQNSPGAGICVRKCTSDADCGGFRADGNGIGTCDHTSHKCVAFDGSEQPPGRDLLCRPIGCDSCWRNSFCTSDSDCPANHACYGDDDDEVDPVDSPACVLRPVLSPTFVNLVCSLAPAKCKEIKDTIEEQKKRIEETLGTVHIPNSFSLGQSIPLISSTVVQFETAVDDITITLRQPTDDIPNHDGVVMLTLNMAQAHLRTADTGGNLVLDTTTDGPFTIQLTYALYTGPSGTNASMAYSGLGFSLVDVNVIGEIELPHLPNISMSVTEDTFKEKLAPFGGKLMGVIVGALGGLQAGADDYLSAPDLLRCTVEPAVGPVPRQCTFSGPISVCAKDKPCKQNSECCGGVDYACTGPKIEGSADALPRSCEPVVQQTIWNAVVDIPYDQKITMHYELCQ